MLFCSSVCLSLSSFFHPSDFSFGRFGRGLKKSGNTARLIIRWTNFSTWLILRSDSRLPIWPLEPVFPPHLAFSSTSPSSSTTWRTPSRPAGRGARRRSTSSCWRSWSRWRSRETTRRRRKTVSPIWRSTSLRRWRGLARTSGQNWGLWRQRVYKNPKIWNDFGKIYLICKFFITIWINA